MMKTLTLRGRQASSYCRPYLLLLFYFIVACLQSIGQSTSYYSSNPKTDGISVEQMRWLDVSQLFTLNPDLSGGIITNTNTPQTGEVNLNVYLYSETVSDGKGTFLYGCRTNGGTTYANCVSWTVYAPFNGNISQTASTDIKFLLQGAPPYLSGLCKFPNLPTTGTQLLGSPIYGSTIPSDCQKYLVNKLQPVIIEVKITPNAPTPTKFKIPGIGEIAATEIVRNRVQQIKYMFSNALQYPNYYIIAAHRGFWESVPENSTAAYDAAINTGADMVELDTRLTSDDTLVAFHDICLDRLTTGSGVFRERTWAQIKDLFLKDRFGNVTTYHPVSIREALTYLKGKALINFDLKDRGPDDIYLKYAFKKAIQIAYQTGTLDQLIIKGKLALTDLQTLLNEVSATLRLTPALTPKDINYNPVVFGWDTKNMPALVNSYIKEPKVLGIELTYKTAYDPILNYVPMALNKSLRVGNYAFWPEECDGVIAEDNFWNDGSCTIAYRQYSYQGDRGVGIPNDGAVLGSGSSSSGESTGENGSPGNVENWEGSSGSGESTGGGSSGSPTSSKPRVKATKPANALDDARGDWDWFFRYGANFAITDRPSMMNDYLTAMGKRDTRIPAITEVKTDTIRVTLLTPAIPLDIDSDGDTVKTTPVINQKYQPFQGLIRRISDYRKVDFFTPDTRNQSINCNLLPSRASGSAPYTNGKYKEDCEAQKQQTGSCNCSYIYGTAPEVNIRRFPLHTLPEWSQLYPTYDIYINANFFDVKEPTPLNVPSSRLPIAKAMYKMPCTDVFGYLQTTGNPAPLSQVSDPDPDHANQDALVLTKTGLLKLVPTDQTTPYYDGAGEEASMAVGGYILAQGGVKKSPMPDGTSKSTPKKKSALGINGYEVFVLSVQNQLTPDDLADYMITKLGCKDVFMFDGGGSATMLSTVGRYPNPVGLQTQDPVYTGITAGTMPQDKNIQNNRGFRPVPSFLAIKAKPF